MHEWSCVGDRIQEQKDEKNRGDTSPETWTTMHKIEGGRKMDGRDKKKLKKGPIYPLPTLVSSHILNSYKLDTTPPHLHFQ